MLRFIVGQVDRLLRFWLGIRPVFQYFYVNMSNSQGFNRFLAAGDIAGQEQNRCRAGQENTGPGKEKQGQA